MQFYKVFDSISGMNKIRIIFVGAVFVIAAIFVLLAFTASSIKMTDKITPLSPFQIMQISGNGNLFYSNTPIENTDLSQLPRMTIENMKFDSEIYLRTDNTTAFEFYHQDTAFIILPNSYLHYNPKTGEIWFNEGQFAWRQISKKTRAEVFLPKSNETPNTPSSRSVALSERGKIKLLPGELRIYSFAGELKYSDASGVYAVTGNNMLSALGDKPAVITPLKHHPEQISPLNETRSISDAENAVLNLNWKAISPTAQYIVRLFSSNLMENVIFEKTTASTRLNISLIQFADFGEFYWQVAALDERTQQEGVPSLLGCVKMTGAIINKEQAMRSPKLKIDTFNTNGNQVLYAGVTDKNTEVFVNGQQVYVDSDGSFEDSITFNTLGIHKVKFIARSPMGLETSVEKTANIQDL